MTRPEVIEALRRMRSLYNGTYAPALDEAIGVLKGADLSGFFDKLWRLAYERGKEEGKAERKTGKWIYGEDEYGIDGYHCDKCGFFVPWDYTHTFINYIEDYKYCPNCGARMEET